MLDRLDAGNAGNRGEHPRPAGCQGSSCRGGDHHVGPVREAGVDLGLLAVRRVEGGGRGSKAARKRDERERARDRAALSAHAGRDGAGEPVAERPDRAANGPVPAIEQQVGDPVADEPDADPGEQRGCERPVVNRHLRRALDGQHKLVAVASGGGEHRDRRSEREQVDAEAGPPGRPSSLQRDAPRVDRQRAGVAPGGERDRRGGDREASRNGDGRPERRSAAACPEARRSERDPADHERYREAGAAAEQADERRLGERETDEGRARRTASSQDREVTSPSLIARARDRDRHERGQQRAREPEEEERDARIEAVAARLVEGCGEVVADDARPLQAALEVARTTVQLAERTCRVAWERAVGELGMDLVAHEVGSGGGERVEERMPARER